MTWLEGTLLTVMALTWPLTVIGASRVMRMVRAAISIGEAAERKDRRGAR